MRNKVIFERIKNKVIRKKIQKMYYENDEKKVVILQ